MKVSYCPYCGGIVEPIQHGDIILRYLGNQKDYPGDVKEGEKAWEKYTAQNMMMALNIPPATFYRGLKGLEKYGLVIRIPTTIHNSDKNRRLSLYIITEAGRRIAKIMMAATEPIKPEDSCQCGGD